MIAYTYGMSEDFPELGAGGVNPMAGPVYHKLPTYGPTALPSYFEDTHIIYEWMRNWVMEVKFDEQGDILKISPFLPGMEFVRPMDMEIGPEGALYVVEWGDTFWGSNSDAQLVRIDYHGASDAGKPYHAVADKVELTLETGEAYAAGDETAQPASIQIESPVNGSFFSFEQPVQFKVNVSDEQGDMQLDQPVAVYTYSGFDTHRILLDTQEGQAGQTIITKEFTHTPDLHLADRFAEIKACVSNSARREFCDLVKLHPLKKEAEHVSWQHDANRQTHGSHPASERFAQTALTTMQVKAGSVLAYDPIHLAEISTVTIRFKQFEETGKIVFRADHETGTMLGEVLLDADNVVKLAEIAQAESVDLAMQHDEAALVQGLNRAVYENWSEVTVPLSTHEKTEALVLTFEGSSDKMLLEIDWMHFHKK